MISPECDSVAGQVPLLDSEAGQAARFNATKTTRYGNPFYKNLEFSRGGGQSAETLNALNILHNVRMPVMISGKIGRKYRQYYQDGHAEAFLISGKYKNIVNHTTISHDGRCEFRVGGLPGRHHLLVASSHINWNFIESAKDVRGGWRPVCMPEGGVIYWGIVRVNYQSVETGKITLGNVPMDNKSGSIREIEKSIGIRLRSNAVRTPSPAATINTGEQ